MADNKLVELQETIYNSKNQTRKYIHNKRKNYITNVINDLAVKSDNALEIGPGSGIYLNLLSEKFNSVTAVDIEEKYLNNIKQSDFSNLELLVDDIKNTKLKKDSFNFILCTEVLEHITEADRVLKNIESILKPGGLLLLTTPQKYSPLEVCSKIAYLPGIINIIEWIYNEPILDAGHINLKTHGELKEIINDIGFDIISTDKMSLYMPLIAEFTGYSGLKFEQYIEKKIKDTKLDFLLWTQCFLLKKV